MNIAKALGVVLLVSVLNPLAPAQSNDRVQQTWKGPDVSTLWGDESCAAATISNEP